jgi:hypothetical protein
MKEARKAKQGGQKTKKQREKNANGREGRRKQKKGFHQMQLNSLALVTFPMPYSQMWLQAKYESKICWIWLPSLDGDQNGDQKGGNMTSPPFNDN